MSDIDDIAANKDICPHSREPWRVMTISKKKGKKEIQLYEMTSAMEKKQRGEVGSK